MNPHDKLRALAGTYRNFPNGGAALQVSLDGIVSDGMKVVTTFPSKREALLSLHRNGFSRVSYGYKLTA